MCPSASMTSISRRCALALSAESNGCEMFLVRRAMCLSVLGRQRVYSAALEYLDRRKFLAFQKLEKRAPSRRDIANASGDAELIDGGNGLSTACYGKRLRFRYGTRDRSRTLRELLELEDADGSVPHDRSGVGEHRCQSAGGFRADVEDQLSRGDAPRRLGPGAGMR